MKIATIKKDWIRFQDRQPTLSIILGSTGLAIAYGIIHDLVTAHVAVEHFTVHHVRLVASKSPIVMALLWGVIATWWFGAGAGLLFALAAQVGDRLPKLGADQVLRAELRTLVGVWVGAMVVLVGIYAFGVSVFPESKKVDALDWRGDVRLMAVALTHSYSYLANALAGLGLTGWILAKRIKLQKSSSAIPQSPDS